LESVAGTGFEGAVKQTIALLSIACVALAGCASGAQRRERSDAGAPPDGGPPVSSVPSASGSVGYEALSAVQQSLLAASGTSAGEYEALPASARATFEAITQALEGTILDGGDGHTWGSAAQLIDRIDEICGEMPNEAGDRQFRLYVTLTEGAAELLQSSGEFERRDDHTGQHAGYPINYRQVGGVPSIQFSLSSDLRRADIDIDYRSDRFPAVLFNGHTTPANSDVRNEGNYRRHVERWPGLVDWWRTR